MSRLDYVTIAIVVVCLAALGFLVYKTIGLMGDEPGASTEYVEETTPPVDTSDYYDYNETDSSDDYDDEIADTTSTEDDDYYADEDTYNALDDVEDPPADEVDSYSNISTGQYMVLAGSFKMKVNAENQVNRLKRMGYDNARVETFNRSAYAVCLVDRFDSNSEANALVSKLKGDGVGAFVKKKK